MTDDPLRPSPELLEKLCGIVHSALHELHGGATDRLCRDDAVIAWATDMRARGLMPPLPPHLAKGRRPK